MSDDEEVLGTDELLDALEAQEFEGAVLLTPRDYARMRQIVPQRVYYFIRTGKLDVERCLCGRKCVRVTEADRVFGTFARSRPEGVEQQREG